VKGLQPLVVLTGAVTGPALGSTLILSAAKSNQFAGPLPGAQRPAFSYLVLGGLRGWADQDGNGQITAREVRDYSHKVLTATVKDRSQEPQLAALRPDEVLGTAFEKAPDLAALQRGGMRPVAAGAPKRDDRMVTVAVAEFRSQGLPPDMAFLGKSFADATLMRLSKGKQVRVVEREFLDQIAAEMKLQKSSMVDERTAVTMGKLLGARIFVFGSVSVLDDEVVVRARTVSVERGEVLDTAEVTGSRRAILPVQKELARQIAATLALESALAPATGLEVNELTVAAIGDLDRLREMARALPLFGFDPARARKKADYLLALQMADRLIATFPRLAPAYYYRALFSLQNDEVDRARQMVEVGLKIAPDDADLLYLRGNAAWCAHDEMRALGAFYELAKRVPDDSRGWYGAGRVLVWQRQTPQAAGMLLEASSRQPFIADLDGNLRTLLGGPDAIGVLNMMRAERPNVYPAGVVYTAYWKGDWAGGEPFAINALAQTPNFYLAHYVVGMASKARGQGQQAVNALHA
jgi:TolB-like protein